MGERDSREVRFDPTRLTTVLDQVPDNVWSLASTFHDTGVHHGYRRVVLVSAGQRQPHAELFGFVLDELAPVWDAWLSWIEPGGFIVPHCDAGPWWERWQVPIAAAGDWHTESGDFTPRTGEAFPVQHWEPHAVTNRGDTPRIHLVVDRHHLLERKPLPFAKFPPSADMADLIERTQT